MKDQELVIPQSGYLDFIDGKKPDWIPPTRVIIREHKKICDTHDPIEVKRGMRPGFRKIKPGEPIDWRKEYS